MEGNPGGPGIALAGFAVDAGVVRNQGRAGAAAGPDALRRALANLAWHQTLPVADTGDITCEGDELEEAQRRLADRVAGLARRGRTPVVLGGGHETAYGSWRGLADAYPDLTIGIVNFDAHFDLREAPRASSGTPFAQIAADCRAEGRAFRYLCLGVAEPSNTAALFARARELGVQWRLDTDMAPWLWQDTRGQLMEFVDSVDLVYLTVDLDVLPAAVMPAVSAPAARGVGVDVVESLIRRIAESGKLALADVVELNPSYDIDGHGARTAARLVWTLCRSLKPHRGHQ
ncbi:formimidoylglutamase [Paludibacterium paludis]|uniref:Formimidoylglutamase n=1 Tax=Paludibacterium paludis TaxID=1225769 RepID=A0A918P1N5_9NEIS|nr:formimidoylglutamase [Paludibacterium paludis]